MLSMKSLKNDAVHWKAKPGSRQWCLYRLQTRNASTQCTSRRPRRRDLRSTESIFQTHMPQLARALTLPDGTRCLLNRSMLATKPCRRITMTTPLDLTNAEGRTMFLMKPGFKLALLWVLLVMATAAEAKTQITKKFF